MKATRKLRRQPQTFREGVRQFLTPQVDKQVRRAAPRSRKCPRWDLQPLVLILLCMTWAAGDSSAEQFEVARGFYVSCYAGRRRPGKTLAGFQKALARVSTRQLRTLAQGCGSRLSSVTGSGCSFMAGFLWGAMDRGGNVPGRRTSKPGWVQRGKRTPQDAAHNAVRLVLKVTAQVDDRAVSRMFHPRSFQK